MEKAGSVVPPAFGLMCSFALLFQVVPEPGHEAGCGKDAGRQENRPERGEQGYDCQQNEQDAHDRQDDAHELEQVNHRRHPLS